MLLSLRPLIGTLVCVGGALAIGVPAAFYAFNRGGYWIDFVLPVVATTLTGLGGDALDRKRFRDSFARYLSRDVMARVLTDAPSLRGEHREVSILFSDLRGFTTLSEQLPPERIASHLNEYFEAMTTAIFAHHGMINDFVGDAVMAVFGAPMADADHAWHAVQSARDMDRALERPQRGLGCGGPAAAAHGNRYSHRSGVRGECRRPRPDQVHRDRRSGERGVAGGRVEQGARHDDPDHRGDAGGGRRARADPRLRASAVKGRVEKVRVFEVLTDGEERT